MNFAELHTVPRFTRACAAAIRPHGVMPHEPAATNGGRRKGNRREQQDDQKPGQARFAAPSAVIV